MYLDLLFTGTGKVAFVVTAVCLTLARVLRFTFLGITDSIATQLRSVRRRLGGIRCTLIYNLHWNADTVCRY